MSRGLRLIPILLLVFIVVSLAWRLIKPADTAVPSQLVERPLPQFTLAAAVPGKPGVASADFGRGEPRLLNIFASWCVPCIGEAPILGELRGKGVKIEAMAVRDTPAATAAFLAANGDPYERIGLDPQSDVQISLGSSGVPETFVIDGHGVIRRQYIGPLTAANVPGIVDELRSLR